MPQNITAADYLGTPPALGVLCPSDKDFVTAALIRAMAAALLANDGLAIGDGSHVEPFGAATLVTASTANVGPDDMLSQSVPGAVVGDWIQWTVRALAATVNIACSVQVVLVEDATGTPVPVTPPGCTQPLAANVTDALVVITGQHQVATAGQVNVFFQGGVSVAGGGNLLSINSDARLDVVHIRPIRP